MPERSAQQWPDWTKSSEPGRGRWHAGPARTQGQVAPGPTPLFGGSIPPREREILDLVAEGCTSTEIARRLGLSPRSVDSSVERTRLRVGARTRLEAVAAIRPCAPTCADAPSVTAPAPGFDGDVRALVLHLLAGATIGDAARQIGLSRRTASRRLADLRRLLDVESTTRALVLAGELIVAAGMVGGADVERVA